MAKRKELFYYLGRDTQYGYPATKMGNMLVCYGNHAGGITPFVNNLIIKLVQEYNPRDISIEIVSSHTRGTVNTLLWRSALTNKRIIPQLKDISILEIGSGEFEKLTYEYLNRMSMRHMNTEQEHKKTVIVIDNFDEFLSTLGDDGITNWEHLIMQSAQYGLYFIALAADVRSFKELVYYFNLKACFRTSVECSKIMLGNDSAAMPSFYAQQVYIKEPNKELQKLYVPFYPDTWIEKFCRYYGVLPSEV